VTHQRPPGQPRGITESCTGLEIDVALPKIVVSELTTRSAGTWNLLRERGKGGCTSRHMDLTIFLPGGRAGAGGGAAAPARPMTSEMAPTSPPRGVLRHTSKPLRWAWA
jgi:hypothetical protein